MESNIKEAIGLLKNNGYFVRKITEQMKNDYKECANNNYNGDCCGCSCNICIITNE